jgi:hypothetical protein
MNIKSFFASSLDPSKVSLTIESLAKMAIFLLGTYAMNKGFDPMQATNQIQAMRDAALVIVPACFALYHACYALYGIVRKLMVAKTV